MNKSIKLRLIVMNVIQWAVWGAYLTSMGSYLVSVGLATKIGIFYAMQGIVSIFMPTLMGIVADKFIPAQKLLGLCHGIAGAGMLGAGFYGMTAGAEVSCHAMATISIPMADEIPIISGSGINMLLRRVDAPAAAEAAVPAPVLALVLVEDEPVAVKRIQLLCAKKNKEERGVFSTLFSYTSNRL